MTSEITTLYSCIPALFMVIGGAIASFYQPGKQLTSATQHFAAGVVFAAVAKELLPKISSYNAPIALIIGFSLGVLCMLLLKVLVEKLEDGEVETNGMSWGLVSAFGIDLLLDGILIGVAFIVGAQGGILIAIALGIEIFFLGLSLAATLGNRKVSLHNSLLTTLILALLIPLGAFAGSSLLVHLPSMITAAVLSFGVAALLYLVTEELLTEAHEIKETPWVTSCFFMGFLLILILESFVS